MDLLVLDKTFTPIYNFDTFQSLLWTNRYSEYGDFEIYTPIDLQALFYLQIGNYLWRQDSDMVMIIEDVQLTSSIEDGNQMKIKGRSLESILDRRIVWEQTNLSGNLQNGIKKLLTDAIISPKDQTRKISNFVFKASADPAITSVSQQIQFTGDNLYEAIKKLCDEHGWGFRVILTDNNIFEFSLYSGTVRDYTQNENPYVVFSSDFDNLTNSDYLESESSLKTVALVAGEGEGLDRRTLEVFADESQTGLYRRELYVDARDISSDNGEEKVSDEDYLEMLKSRGVQYLNENIFVKAFSGGIDSASMFQYGRDYFIGDIVQIKNEYGIEARVRITELIRSESPSEIGIYPTFVIVEDEEVS